MDYEEVFPASEFYCLTSSEIFDNVRAIEYLRCRFCDTTFEIEEAVSGFRCPCYRIYTLQGSLMYVDLDWFTKSHEDEERNAEKWEEHIRQRDIKKKMSKHNRNNS